MQQHFLTTLSLLAAILAFATRRAAAVDYTWTGNAGDGRFISHGNWTPLAGPPDDSTDRAIFDTSGTFAVEVGTHSVPEITNRSLEVRRGRVTLNLLHLAVPGISEPSTYNLASGGGLTTSASIGTQSGVTAEVTVYGFATFGYGEVNPQGALTVGTVADSNGRLTLTGVDWNGESLITIGNAGTGRVDVGVASRMTSATATLGFAADSHGTLRVVGDSDPFRPTTLSLSSGMVVGRQGTGNLTVTDATLTNDGNASMAQIAGSSAVATVNDRGVWNANASLYVGGGSGGAGGGALLTVTGDGSTSTPGGRVTVADDVTVYPTGAITITGDGTLEVGGVLTAHPGSNLHLLQGGTLRLDAIDFQPAADTFNWTTGTLHMTSNFDVDQHAVAVNPLGSTVSITDGKNLLVDGTLRVGAFDTGFLEISNAQVTSAAAQIGSVIPTTGGATVGVANSTGDWDILGDLRVGGLPANGRTQLFVSFGAELTNRNAYVAAPSADPLAAEIALSEPGTVWTNTGSLYLGGDATGAGGNARLSIERGASLVVGVASVGGGLTVWDRGLVTMDDGHITSKNLTVRGAIVAGGPFSGDITLTGALDVDGGTLQLTPGNSVSVGNAVTVRHGGQLTATIDGDGGTQVSLADAGSTWTTPTALVIGSSTAGVGRIRSLSVAAGSTVSLGDNAALVTAADSLTLDGGTINAASVDMGSATLAGHGVINANFTTTGDILASGDLTLGNAASTAGFSTTARLFTFASTVTLNDANAARLGTHTNLGFFGSPGALIVPNGFVLDPGESLVGSGDVDTLNDPTKPLTNNGSITGATTTARLGLSGFVNGTGTFDNVVFIGTFSPGHSPATVNLGNAEYAETSTLILEVAGPAPGTQHDQLIHSGAAVLGGTLDVDLLGGFIPAAEQSFTLMTYGAHTGQFASLDLPPLPAGLTWALDYGPNWLVLSTTSGKNLPGDIDLDGDVDRADAALFTPHLGAADSVWTTGDFDGDHVTTLDDLFLLQANLGQTLPSPVAHTAIPEPSSLIFLLVSAVIVAIRRRAAL